MLLGSDMTQSGYGITQVDGTVKDSRTGEVYSERDWDNSNHSLVKDSQSDAIEKLAKDLNLKLTDDTKDYLYQYYLQRKNDEWAYARQNEYDSTRYQRTVADLQKAGINPFLALQSLSPSSSNVSSGSITSGSITSRRNTDKEANTNIGRGIMTVIGIIAAAIIGAML